MSEVAGVAATDVAETYLKRGFAVARDVADRDTVLAVRAIAKSLMVENGLTDGQITSAGQLRYLQGDHLAGARRVAEELTRCELLETLARSPRISAVVDELLGGNVFIHPVKWVRTLPPQASDLSNPAGVHQDFPELQGSLNQVTMWCPIFDVGPDTGSLPVYEAGTPRRILPMRIADNPSGWEISPASLGAPSVFHLGPGDALFFNTLTPHGGSVNIGPGWRVSVEIRFQPLADPIAETNLARPILGGSWDDHYEGWVRYGHYWRERQPVTSRFDDTWERWRDLAAIDAGQGERGGEAFSALTIAARFAKSSLVRDEAARLLRELDE